MNPGPPALALQLMDAASDLMAVKNLAGRFVAANRVFRDVAGIAVDRVAVLTNGEVFEAAAASRLTCAERLAVLTDESVSCQVEVRWQGQPRTLHAVCTPWREHDRCHGVVLSAQLSTRQDVGRLEDLATGVGELAHKFNNALTTVVGLADWHLVAGEPPPALRADLEKIRDAAGIAERTAREIQQLTRSAAEGRAGPALAVPAAHAASPYQEPEAVKQARILVVDDEADVRASLSVMVRTLGYDVQSVESGHAALDVIGREPVSLVISGLSMPAMDGLELAARLREAGRDVPLVLLGALAGPRGATPLPAGVVRVLGKPLRMAALREVLTPLLPLPPDVCGPAQVLPFG